VKLEYEAEATLVTKDSGIGCDEDSLGSSCSAYQKPLRGFRSFEKVPTQESKARNGSTPSLIVKAKVPSVAYHTNNFCEMPDGNKSLRSRNLDLPRT